MGQNMGTAKVDDRYYLQKVKLGQGSFGTVWRGVDRRSNEVVAVKQLDKAAMPRRGVRRQDIQREVHVMEAVVHENITRLLGCFEDQHSIYLALEYCDGGDFGDKVKERGMNLSEPEAAEWMRQIVAAIGALHTKAIVHRDIKPDNFMVHKFTLKLSDFGLAIFVGKDRLLTDKCGTPAFMAPEQHRLPRHSRGYALSCDIWAAGVTMYMLMFGGKHPFLAHGNQLDEKRLLAGSLDFHANQGFLGFSVVADKRYSDPARQLCRRMVEPDPNKRLTSEQARQDRWLLQGVRQPAPDPALARHGSAPGELQLQPPRRAGPPDAARPPPEQLQRAERRAKTASPAVFATPPSAVAPVPVCDDDALVAHKWWPWSGIGVENSPPNAQQAGQQQDHNVTAAKVLSGDSSEAALHKRIEALEADRRMLQEQNESQWEALVHSKQVNLQLEQEKKKLVELQHRQAPSMPADADAAAAGRGAADAREGAAPGAPQAGEARGGVLLPAGTRCNYNSSSWSGHIPASVTSFNESDGTYNLDVRQHALPENISPAQDVKAAEAWPPGALVYYQSSTIRDWLPAVIKSFNEGTGSVEGTYNLDVREFAAVDRMRPRLA